METSSDINGNDLMQIIEKMNEKLDKLDKLDTIEARLDNIDTDIKDLKHSLTYQQDVVAEVQSVQSEHQEKLKSIEDTVEKIEQEKKKLEREIIDMRAHSVRSNLIFYNIKEENDQGQREKVEDKIKKLLTDKLEIEDATEKIEIERAHRLGNNKQGPKPRPIVVKFLRYQDKEKIKKLSYKDK